MIKKVFGKTEYYSRLEEDTDVYIGGNFKKFVPNINMSKWNDEAWLNINHKETIVSGEATLKTEEP